MQPDGIGVHVPVLHLVFDLGVAAVVDDDEGDRQAEFDGGDDLLDGEHRRTIADDAHDRPRGGGELRSDRCRDAVAQGCEAWHVQQLVWGVGGERVNGAVVGDLRGVTGDDDIGTGGCGDDLVQMHVRRREVEIGLVGLGERRGPVLPVALAGGPVQRFMRKQRGEEVGAVGKGVDVSAQVLVQLIGVDVAADDRLPRGGTGPSLCVVGRTVAIGADAPAPQVGICQLGAEHEQHISLG